MDAFSSSRRIAWLCTGIEVYGIRQAVLNLAGGVRARGWRPQIICLAHGPFADECAELGFDEITVGLEPPPKIFGSLLERALIYRELLGYRKRATAAVTGALAGEAPEALHFLQPNIVPIAGAIAQTLGVPCFWEMPNYISDNYPLGINRVLLRRACARFNVQPLSNSAFTASTLGEGRVKPIVFHLGVDRERFDPDAVTPRTRSELGIPEDAVVLGVFARICPQKGQHIVLDAMARVQRELGPGARLDLLLLGDADSQRDADRLSEMARSLGVEDRVHMLGRVPDPERYYAVVDVPINARVDPEPFGLSVVEAMMMRRPVLVHALGGPAETVTDGRTGWHVTEPRPEAFAAAIRRAIDDRGRWPLMGEAARADALERFSLESMTTRYERIVSDRLAA